MRTFRLACKELRIVSETAEVFSRKQFLARVAVEETPAIAHFFLGTPDQPQNEYLWKILKFKLNHPHIRQAIISRHVASVTISLPRCHKYSTRNCHNTFSHIDPLPTKNMTG